MTATQISFDLRTRAARKARGPELARRMIAMLAARKQWTRREDFRKTLGLTERECRLGREASHGRILQGQKGYKLLRDATPDEVREASNDWISRIKACQEQHALLMRRAHKVLASKEGWKTL